VVAVGESCSAISSVTIGFVSFGPWESLEAIETWRSLDGWKERVERVRELLVSFEPSTLEPIVEHG
jgi:hypothetical protein